MEAQERSEIREMIHGILSGWEANTIARDDLTNERLKNIADHLGRLNGSVAKHEEKINGNLPHTIANCAQKDTIQEIRDKMITNDSNIKFEEKKSSKIMAKMSVLIAIMAVIVSSFIGIQSCKEKQAWIEKLKEEQLRGYSNVQRGGYINDTLELNDTLKW
jgi:hypothetical protein